MQPIPISYRRFFALMHPWMLLAGLVLYALGAGIAVFLGRPLRWDLYLLGQGCLTALQISSYTLQAYFTTPLDEEQIRRIRTAPEEQPAGIVPRNALLLTGLGSLALVTAAAFFLSQQGSLAPVAVLFLVLAFVLAIGYAVPPFQLSERGYGELIQALLVVNLFPTIAYVLQVGELHRLLMMLTFPLTLLYLAMSLAVSLQSYYPDVRQERQTLLTRLGWQRGMQLHNLLVLISYLLIGLSAALGQPWSLTWPALLTFPIGLFQVFLMWQISIGSPPRWQILRLTAYASLGMLIYLFTFALWVA